MSPRYVVPKKIIGNDNGYDYSDPRVVQINATYPSGNLTVSTATFIGPRSLVTAGHCVYNKDYGGWAKRVTLEIPGWGRVEANNLYAFEGWTIDQNNNWEIGVIELPQDFTDYVGYCGFAVNNYKGQPITILQRTPNNEGKGSDGFIEGIEDNLIIYRNDTIPSPSGGSIFPNPSTKVAVIGIHFSGLTDYDFNRGIRITDYLFDWLYQLSRSM